MNESQAMPAPGTYFATNNGTDSLSLVGALKTNPLDEVTAYAAMDIKHEIWKAESDVQKAIQVQTNYINQNNLNLHNRLCESEKAAIEAKYESIIAIKDNTLAVIKEVEHCCEENTEMLTAFEKSVDEKFCNVEKLISDKFCAAEKQILLDRIATLESAANSGTIASAVASALKTTGVIK